MCARSSRSRVLFMRAFQTLESIAAHNLWHTVQTVHSMQSMNYYWNLVNSRAMFYAKRVRSAQNGIGGASNQKRVRLVGPKFISIVAYPMWFSTTNRN